MVPLPRSAFDSRYRPQMEEIMADHNGFPHWTFVTWALLDIVMEFRAGRSPSPEDLFLQLTIAVRGDIICQRKFPGTLFLPPEDSYG